MCWKQVNEIKRGQNNWDYEKTITWKKPMAFDASPSSASFFRSTISHHVIATLGFRVLNAIRRIRESDTSSPYTIDVAPGQTKHSGSDSTSVDGDVPDESTSSASRLSHLFSWAVLVGQTESRYSVFSCRPAVVWTNGDWEDELSLAMRIDEWNDGEVSCGEVRCRSARFRRTLTSLR